MGRDLRDYTIPYSIVQMASDRRSIMHRFMLTALGLGALAPLAATAQVPQEEPLRGDSLTALPTAPGDLDGRPSLALMAITGTAGSFGGLYSGLEAGSLVGALLGAAAGTALGIELGSAGRVSPGKAAGAALLGMLAGLTVVHYAKGPIHERGDLLLLYSIPQGLLAAAAAAGRVGPIWAREKGAR
jgi:hypothetical protein